MKINKNLIIDKIKSFFSGIKAVIKQAFSAKGSKRYLILAFFMFIIFFAATFPYDVLIVDMLKKQEGKFYKTIQIDGFDISFITGIKLQNINTVLINGNEIKIKNLYTNPSLFSLLGKSAVTPIKSEFAEYTSGVSSYSAAVDGSIDLSFSGGSELPNKGTILLDLNDILLKGLTLQGFNIPPVKIKKTTIKILFTGNEMVIQDITFTGGDLNGSIKGSIYMDTKIFPRSRLMINVSIDADSPLLDNYKMLVASFINPSTNKLSLNFKGTVANPVLEMPKSVSQPDNDNQE